MSEFLSNIGEDFWRGWPQRRSLNADAVGQGAEGGNEAGGIIRNSTAENWGSRGGSASAAACSLPDPLTRPSAGLLASWPVASARYSRSSH